VETFIVVEGVEGEIERIALSWKSKRYHLIFPAILVGKYLSCVALLAEAFDKTLKTDNAAA